MREQPAGTVIGDKNSGESEEGGACERASDSECNCFWDGFCRMVYWLSWNFEMRVILTSFTTAQKKMGFRRRHTGFKFRLYISASCEWSGLQRFHHSSKTTRWYNLQTFTHTHLHCKFSEGNLQKRAVHNQLASECSMLLIHMQIKTLKVYFNSRWYASVCTSD